MALEAKKFVPSRTVGDESGGEQLRLGPKADIATLPIEARSTPHPPSALGGQEEGVQMQNVAPDCPHTPIPTPPHHHPSAFVCPGCFLTCIPLSLNAFDICFAHCFPCLRDCHEEFTSVFDEGSTRVQLDNKDALMSDCVVHCLSLHFPPHFLLLVYLSLNQSLNVFRFQPPPPPKPALLHNPLIRPDQFGWDIHSTLTHKYSRP